MPPKEKQKLIVELSTQLPNLREITLDMNGIDVSWQMITAVQLAKGSPLLKSVIFQNADPRATEIMRRFTGWGCSVATK